MDPTNLDCQVFCQRLGELARNSSLDRTIVRVVVLGSNMFQRYLSFNLGRNRSCLWQRQHIVAIFIQIMLDWSRK